MKKGHLFRLNDKQVIVVLDRWMPQIVNDTTEHKVRPAPVTPDACLSPQFFRLPWQESHRHLAP